ncbi:MAG: hypothetical protein ABJE47_22115 [bacterium]
MPRKVPPRAVREPMQVYLDVSDQSILERAALSTGLPKTEVLRRGLRRYAAELLAEESPALAFLNSESSAPAPDAPADVAERHDEYLADWEMASWEKTPAPRAPKAARKRRK